jgi:hypothetical protein
MCDSIMIQEQINKMIRRLKEAVEVNYTAPEKEGQGYPYAAGYSRSAMQSIIEDLQRLQLTINTELK